jgi:hypothetical protein
MSQRYQSPVANSGGWPFHNSRRLPRLEVQETIIRFRGRSQGKLLLATNIRGSNEK